MCNSIGRAGFARATLAFVFAATATGCSSYEVKAADRDNFALAKVQVSKLVSAVEEVNRQEGEDPAIAESLRQLHSKEATLAELLARKNLKAGEARGLQETLAAYRERLTDLAESTGLEESAAPVEKNLSRIEENLSAYLANHQQEFSQDLQTSLGLMSSTLAVVDQARGFKKDAKEAAPAGNEAFERKLRMSVTALGDTLLAADQSLEQQVELRVAARAGNPKRVAAARRKLADVDAAILAWLEEVDANLKAVAATGAVPPGFLEADRLAKALGLSARPGETGDRDDALATGLAVGAGAVEELFSAAKSFGVEPRHALAILSEEFSKVVAKYEAMHRDAEESTAMGVARNR